MPAPVLHPKPGDHGEPVVIKHPSAPSSPSTWLNVEAMATWTPGSLIPEALNGIRAVPWTDVPTTDEGWRSIAGQADIDEPPMKPKPGMHVASGCVIVEPDGRVWIMEPSNHHRGYRATFPKGRADSGLPLQASAIREVHEETGLRVQVFGLLGDFTRTTSVSRYYLARRVGGSPAEMGWESQAVHLVPQALLPKVLPHPADQPVLKALQARPIPPIGRQNILQSYTLASATRIVATVADFRARFGAWPTRILLDAGMAEGIKEHVLTPLGWAMLEGKLELSPTVEGTVIAQGADGATLEYSLPGDDLHEAEAWIWGCVLSEFAEAVPTDPGDQRDEWRS